MAMLLYNATHQLTTTNKQQVIIMENFKRENMIKDVIVYTVAATYIVLALALGISILVAVI